MDLAAFEDMVGRIYDASTNPDSWPSVIENLADLVGGQSAWLSRLNLADGTGSGIVVRMDPDAQRRYFGHYNTVDPLCNVDDRRPLADTYVITDEDRLSKDELLGTEFYNDFMTGVDAHSVLMFRLAARGSTVYGVNINRSRRQGRFDQADMTLAKSLQGHLTRSLHIAQRLEAHRLLELGSAAGRVSGQGLMLLDRGGRIVFAEAAAEALLARPGGLCVKNGRLGAVDPVAANVLGGLIDAAASPIRTLRRAGSMIVCNPKDGTPLRVVVAPSQPGRLPVFGDERYAVVSLDAPDPAEGGAAKGGAADQLMDLFGFTAAEARVTHALMAGQTLRDIALATGVSLNTIRSHLAHIFGKAGVRRQTELLRLLMHQPGGARQDGTGPG